MSEGTAADPTRRDASSGLSAFRKILIGLGDHSVNVALSSISFLFLFFLTDVAGLEPILAGAVVWIARLFDAGTDPAMGRLSDLTRTRWGRRRPWFLVGMVPLGLFFALLWRVPFDGQWQMFAYYTAIYMGVSLSTTIVSVPYIALLPEMALGYDERTSLNAFRAVLTLMGSILAASMLLMVRSVGGGPEAFALVATGFAVWLMVPWPFVFGVSFERPRLTPEDPESFREALQDLRKHSTYWRLSTLYILTRIAIDLSSVAMPYYFTHWIGREDLFFKCMLALLGSAALSLPVWLRIAQTTEKHKLMRFGMIWWGGWSLALFAAQPDWPVWLFLVCSGLLGVGFAVVDLMPWAMLGETIDEGQALAGVRRDGIYSGFFTFLRKAGGATATLLAGALLQVSGYTEEPPQPESALFAIRMLLAGVPAILLVLAVLRSGGYPLTRARHAEIQQQIARHSEASADPGPSNA